MAAQGCQSAGMKTVPTAAAAIRRSQTMILHRRTLMWVCMCRTTTSSRLRTFFDSAMPPSCQFGACGAFQRDSHSSPVFRDQIVTFWKGQLSFQINSDYSASLPGF